MHILYIRYYVPLMQGRACGMMETICNNMMNKTQIHRQSIKLRLDDSEKTRPKSTAANEAGPPDISGIMYKENTRTKPQTLRNSRPDNPAQRDT